MSAPRVPSIRFNLFPGGLSHAVTVSYDDGVVADRDLVALLNRHGLKGTFHLNSGKLGREGQLHADEVAALFAGHEISAHSVTHPRLPTIPPDELAREIVADRRALEALAGYPVRGMSYPFGYHSPEVVAALPHFGIDYARTTASHGWYGVPENLLLWHPTCHHNDDLLARTETFFAQDGQELRLLYVWGHSYEFPNDGNWDLMERFGERIAVEAARKGKGVWRATNVEIANYLRALRGLRTTVDGTQVENPSALPLWITWGGERREIAPGARVSF
ncbi:Polysaccharide deacetylase [Verrucomicrobium sp. GAS474]|uniref:polysaccharide deacetylase family protein n=1 Tax=Verrucomicrobium sp. GAS474 TaxID=1882831 RepID=UPI00087D5271|nr:polysaccharide deacetylase family protein [Verrucomicrobium sp. GAS474]SDT92766.1 Polysaccharide deacetylase [Verrucomicrobium sp. GAS474]